MHRAKLLHRRPMPLTTDNIPVATDVFLHRLEWSHAGSSPPGRGAGLDALRLGVYGR